MKRFATLLGVAAIAFAWMPVLAQAQVIVVQPTRVYAPPVIVSQPVVRSYYVSPRVSYYSAPVVTYSSPPVVTYSSPGPVVTYSAPAAVLAPAPGFYETRTYYGLGIFRPRGWYTETYYRP
jgi:hypothetical protein